MTETTSATTRTRSPARLSRWYPVALTLTALTMGLEFAHVLELVPKLGYPPELYLQLQRTLYHGFGTVGGAIYVGAVLAAGNLAWRLRGVLAPAAFALQAVALTTWLALIAPVNSRWFALAPGEVPPDFAALRTQWEYSHALGFVLFATALLLLLAVPRGARR